MEAATGMPSSYHSVISRGAEIVLIMLKNGIKVCQMFFFSCGVLHGKTANGHLTDKMAANIKICDNSRLIVNVQVMQQIILAEVKIK